MATNKEQIENSGKCLFVETTTKLSSEDLLKAIVEVQLDTKDKRRKNVYLLAAGKELFEKAIPCLFQTEKQLTKGLSPTEIQQLQDILYKVIKNV